MLQASTELAVEAKTTAPTKLKPLQASACVEERTRASSEGDSSHNGTVPPYDEDEMEETLSPRTPTNMHTTLNHFKANATGWLTQFQASFEIIYEYRKVLGVAQGWMTQLWKYLPFILASLPCVMLLTVPVMAMGLLFVVAALPALCIAPALFFVTLPVAWPYLKFDKKKLPISEGVLLSISLMLVPVCSLACLPVLFLSPIALLVMVPIFIFFIPALLILALPGMFFLSFIFGGLLLFFHSPVPEIIKKWIVKARSWLTSQNLKSAKAYWTSVPMKYLKLEGR